MLQTWAQDAGASDSKRAAPRAGGLSWQELLEYLVKEGSIQEKDKEEVVKGYICGEIDEQLLLEGMSDADTAVQWVKSFLAKQANNTWAREYIVSRSRGVATGRPARPLRDFYVPPTGDAAFTSSVTQLVEHAHVWLMAEQYTGKTTWAFALTRALQAQKRNVLFMSLQHVASQDFTAQGIITTILQKMNIQWIPGKSPSQQLAACLGQLQNQVIIIDDADRATDLADEELCPLMQAMEVFRSSPVRVLMIGTHLLRIQGRTHFTPDKIIKPPRFTTASVELLLQQLSEVCQPALPPDTMASVAASIQQCTDGHRGLVGVCLSVVEEMLMSGDTLTPASFTRQERRLPLLYPNGSLFAYYGAIEELITMQGLESVQHLMRTLMYSAGQCRLVDRTACEQLQVAGIVTKPDDDTIRISSPHLLAALMHFTTCLQPASKKPVPFATTAELEEKLDLHDARSVCLSMILCGVKYMALPSHTPSERSNLPLYGDYGLCLNLALAIQGAARRTLDFSYHTSLPKVQMPQQPANGTVPQKEPPNGPATQSAHATVQPASAAPQPPPPPHLSYLYKSPWVPQTLMEFAVYDGTSTSQHDLQAHYAISKLHAAAFDAPCFFIVMSFVRDEDMVSFPELGIEDRQDIVVKRAGLRPMTDSASGEPSVEPQSKQGQGGVEIVQVRLCLDKGCGHVKFHNDSAEHKVELKGTSDLYIFQWNRHHLQNYRFHFRP